MTDGADDDFWLARVPPEQHGIWAAPSAGPTLLAAARAATGPDGPMPDDPPPQESSDGIPWAPGALAEILASHTRAADQAQPPFLALARLVQDHRHGRVTRGAIEETYEALKPVKLATPRDIDLAIAAVGRPSAQDTPSYLGALAVVCGWLVTRGAHRGPVKAGLAAASFFSWDPLVPRAADLGRFTELSAEACSFLVHQLPVREAELVALARWHDGWGRIHAVRALGRLDERTGEVDDWLVDEGWHNRVHSGYTAPLIAGRVDVASRVLVLGPDGTPDRARLDSVRGLMEALLDEDSPGAHLADVPGMLLVVDQWFLALSMLPAERIRLQDLRFADALRTQLRADTADLAESFGHAGTERIVERCTALLLQAPSRLLVADMLGRPADPEFLVAARLAPLHGIDPLPSTLERLTRQPDDSLTWYWLAMDHRPDLGTDLVDFALRVLPPELVTRSIPLPGARRDLSVHTAVLALWQGPGQADPAAAWRIIEALLRSPALAARERGARWLDKLPPDVVVVHAGALEQLAGQEPDDGVRAAITAALAAPRQTPPTPATHPPAAAPPKPPSPATPGVPSDSEALVRQSLPVRCWRGEKMGPTVLNARLGTLVLTSRRLVFQASGTHPSADITLESITACGAGRRRSLVVRFRGADGQEEALTFGLRKGMPDLEAWVADIQAGKTK